MSSRRVEVCVTASRGGHLALLLSVRDAFAAASRAYVVPPGDQADRLVAEAERVVFVPDPGRSPAGWLRNVRAGIRAARELRPRVVVSAGAGATVAFCLAARLLGARLVFVETMARVVDRSRSGRLLAPLADRVFVQWPELLELYPRAELCRPALLEARPEEAAPPGQGTLVAVGTHASPFQRLLDLADAGVEAGLLPTPVVAQVGPGSMRHADRAVATLAPAELDEAIRASELVICHAGSGLVSQAVRAGRTPLLLARRRERGEHVDDHQVGTAEKLDELGFAVSLDSHELGDAVALARRPPAAAPEGASLAERLREAVSDR